VSLAELDRRSVNPERAWRIFPPVEKVSPGTPNGGVAAWAVVEFTAQRTHVKSKRACPMNPAATTFAPCDGLVSYCLRLPDHRQPRPAVRWLPHDRHGSRLREGGSCKPDLRKQRPPAQAGQGTGEARPA